VGVEYWELVLVCPFGSAPLLLLLHSSKTLDSSKNFRLEAQTWHSEELWSTWTNNVIKKSQNKPVLSTTWCSFGDSSLDIILFTISVGTKVSVELSTDGKGGGGGISGVGTTLSTTSSFGSVFSSSSPFATDSLFDSRLSIVLQWDQQILILGGSVRNKGYAPVS
jgi:hypothetical protein